MSTNGAGKADHTVAPQHESDSDPVLACAYCTNAVTTRSKTRREKGAFAELRAQALAEQPKYVALHQELNELEVHVGEELPLFASLAGKLQLLEGIDRYYDAIRLCVCSLLCLSSLSLGLWGLGSCQCTTSAGVCRRCTSFVTSLKQLLVFLGGS